MKHIPARLVQKVKKHFNEKTVKKSYKKYNHDELNGHDLYTGAIGAADIQRLKSVDSDPLK